MGLFLVKKDNAMKYEISINISESDSLVVQEAADNQLHDLYKKATRKNKAAIRNIRDALAFLLPSPESAFYSRSNVAMVVIDDDAHEDDEDDEDDENGKFCRNFLDAMVAIAGEFVSVRTLSE
ncbi:MAG: hypothetical protein M0Z50_09805 [Planctomycetia bacterium]|nr:hypothetical protein [Planctomycetia bacterium]